MSPRDPRPPGRPAGRTRQVLANEDPGRCHLCSAVASHICRQCYQPVCDEHLVELDAELRPIFGQDACQDCARQTVTDLARDEGQWAHKRSADRIQRTCAICGREFEQVLPQCAKCARHVCSVHGSHYRKRFRFGARRGAEPAWYWDHTVRCEDHRLDRLTARLRGWQLV